MGGGFLSEGGCLKLVGFVGYGFVGIEMEGIVECFAAGELE